MIMGSKLLFVGISSFGLGLTIGILIIYFLGARKFFSFMKIDRMNMCSEIQTNVKEVVGEVDRRAMLDQPEHKLIEEKGENLDGKEE